MWTIIWFAVLTVTLVSGLAYIAAKGRGSEAFIKRERTVDLVIARYKEDLGWVKMLDWQKFRRIVIYNKGGDVLAQPTLNSVVRELPNVGRCDHTYLWHILLEWEDLADSTVFLPGSGDMTYKWPLVKHTVRRALNTGGSVFMVNRVRDVRAQLWNFSLDKWSASAGANARANPETELKPSKDRPFGLWYEKNFGNVVVNGVVYYGIFAVSKEDIYHRSREEYARLIKYVSESSNPEAGHYFERAWLAVFHPVDQDAIAVYTNSKKLEI